MHSSSYIGDYIPIKTLGSGATGKVKLARHARTGQYVALKIITKHLLDRKRVLHQKVHREIAIMKLVAANCHHIDNLASATSSSTKTQSIKSTLGVLGLQHVYETDNSFVLVLDYCHGGELFDLLLQVGHFNEHHVLDFFQQLVYALQFCHNRGICHRDLKPENVLLTADGRLKLADFGMASLLTPGAFLETSCGSPQYCAPEILRGEQYQGQPADIWSLGVVLFALATGGLPFDDENLHALITKIRSGAYHMPPGVPPQLASLIKSMLVVDPTERPTINDIKNSPWFNSRPCRPDIYKDEDLTWKKLLAASAENPVNDPDPTILTYLAHLGLGDIPTIKRRLGMAERTMERDFYFQLSEFCYDDLAFREILDLPSSPTHVSPVSSPQAVNFRVSPFSPTDHDSVQPMESLGDSRAHNPFTAQKRVDGDAVETYPLANIPDHAADLKPQSSCFHEWAPTAYGKEANSPATVPDPHGSALRRNMTR